MTEEQRSATEQDRLARAREALEAAEQMAASPARSGGAPEQPPRPVAGSGRGAEPDPYATARRIALRHLTLGPRTREQLADALAQRDCPQDVAAAVLDRLTDVGLIDDLGYATMLVRSRQETKGLARRALIHELRHKGVAEEHIDAALQDAPVEAERERAYELVAKRLAAMHGLDREVQTRRLAGFLARKGYRPGVSYEVIREVLDAAPEHRRD